jgi:thiosulfate dehydrogenase
MKKQISFIMICFLSLSTYASSDELKPDTIAEGGRLYDKWWKELKLKKPTSTHSSYPATGKKKGAATWRCKECHGWDYKGVKGAYGEGNHKTAIKGIREAENMSTQNIIATLKNKLHGYNDVIPDTALTQIANFVKNGQVDIESYLNKKTLLTNGNQKRGKSFFNKSCKQCHGSDGRKINFKTYLNPEYLGTVATENPTETIHKLRNGNPNAFVNGKSMPNMNKTLNLKEQIDLLSYLQTLPVK